MHAVPRRGFTLRGHVANIHRNVACKRRQASLALQRPLHGATFQTTDLRRPIEGQKASIHPSLLAGGFPLARQTYLAVLLPDDYQKWRSQKKIIRDSECNEDDIFILKSSR